MIAACITARNEAKTIQGLTWTLCTLGFRVYVMDDGSTDSTAGFASHVPDVVVGRHERPQGIGPSLLELWRRALADGATSVVQLDAGGSHHSAYAHRLRMVLNEADVVVGSRFLPDGAYMGGARQYASRLASAMCNLRTGQRLTDWTSGYRAFNRAALAKLLVHDYRCRMHGWQIEVLGHALRDGLRVVEVPITYWAGSTSFRAATACEAFRAWTQL